MTPSQLTKTYNCFVTLLLGMSVLNLIVAYSAEYFLHIRPCILCIYTRYIYIGLIISTFLAYREFLTQRIALYVIGSVLLSGTLFAIYHTGVENQWWSGTAACYNTLDFSSLEALQTTLEATPYSPCDVVQWRFLGISVTLWNAVWFSAFLMGYMALQYATYRTNRHSLDS